MSIPSSSQRVTPSYENHELHGANYPSHSNPNDFVSVGNLEHSISSGEDLSSNTTSRLANKVELGGYDLLGVSSPPSIHHYHKKSQ